MIETNQAAAQFAEVSLESFGDHASSSSNNEFQKQFWLVITCNVDIVRPHEIRLSYRSRSTGIQNESCKVFFACALWDLCGRTVQQLGQRFCIEGANTIFSIVGDSYGGGRSQSGGGGYRSGGGGYRDQGY